MPEDSDRRLFDKRVVQRYIRKGRLDEREYERHLKGLPDLASEAVPVESDLDVDDFDDLEDEPDDLEPVAEASAPAPAVETAPSAPPTPGDPPPGEPPSEG
jgi:hypothetical protein